MKIAIVAPSPVPFTMGGAEHLFLGLRNHLDAETQHEVEIVKLPTPERNLWEVLDSYRRFARLDLDHFDMVISGKYPAWMVRHRNHVCYMLHRLRGLYDTYFMTGAPIAFDCDHSGIEDLRTFMSDHDEKHEALDEFFDRLDTLRRSRNLPPEAVQFPGPWARELVHFLDGIGLSPRAITRWASISSNLVRRVGTFPQGVSPLVLPPPSHLAARSTDTQSHWFAIGRLDEAKRISLWIEAMQATDLDIPLRIAGSGPQEEFLRELAAGDPRIEFLGRITDREAAKQYSESLAVLYAPYDEDYGFVTIEAMQAGRPVVTTHDAGGPLDFVTHEKTGLVAEADPAALARCLERIDADHSWARRMGRAGRARVRSVEWGAVRRGLLGESSVSVRPTTRRRLVVATSFEVHAARGGGQVRVSELYRHLGPNWEVELVSLAPPGASAQRRTLAPRFHQTSVPATRAHAEAETELSRRVDWIPVTDVALASLHDLTPDYGVALSEASRGAAGAVACHPYPYEALRRACPELPILYEAQDVETDLKAAVLPDTEAGRALLEQVRSAERTCCQRSIRILSCSHRDARRLIDLFDLDAERLTVVPNGVDVARIPFIDPKRRSEERAALDLQDTLLVLFLASWHPPNLEASRYLLQIADARPEIRFLIAGSVVSGLEHEKPPPNLAFLGEVDDRTKDRLLAACHVAVNPMASGSGTNLKMLEYAAAGIPILSSPHGARGLDFEDGRHLRIAPIADFGEALDEILSRGEADAHARARCAREFVEEHYPWASIGASLADVLDAEFVAGTGSALG